MPLSTDITLPSEQVPVFPDRCVRCEKDNQGNTIRLWTNKVGWWTLLTFFGRPISVSAPACRPCSWMIRFQRVGGVICLMALAWLVLWFVYPWVQANIAAPLKKYVAMGLILVALSPWFLWELICPPCFDITAFGDETSYEFRSEEYADEFLDLNIDYEEVLQGLRQIERE